MLLLLLAEAAASTADAAAGFKDDGSNHLFITSALDQGYGCS
jgi:hypothetical protein